jgi:hypothetical protein
MGWEGMSYIFYLRTIYTETLMKDIPSSVQ